MKKYWFSCHGPYIGYEYRYLHHNSIKELHPTTFSNLGNLERLFLHNNRIQRIPAGAFENLKKLKRL